MRLLVAVLLRLFAATRRPRASLAWRAVGLIGAVIIIAGFTRHFTPKGFWATGQMTSSRAFVLIALLGYAFTTVLFMLLHAAQRAALRRLEVVRQLPLTTLQLRALYALAYGPLGLLVTGVMAPGLFTFFGGGLPPPALGCAVASAVLVAVGANVLLRLAVSWPARWPQSVSLVGVVLATALTWTVYRSGQPLPQLLAWLFIAGIVGLSLYWLTRPVRTSPPAVERRRREHHRLDLTTAVFLRASRSRRYLGVNGLLLGTLVLLGFVSHHSRAVIPFDAVAVVTLLLAGTLGQEARGLSRSTYPLELVYGWRVGQWLRALWGLALTNALLVVGCILLSAAVYFPGQLSVSASYVLCTSLCLTAAASLAASLVAPQQDDALAQLASTGLYAMMAWGVSKLLAWPAKPWVPVLALALVGSCVGLAYLAETKRWLLTIRGKRGFLFATK